MPLDDFHPWCRRFVARSSSQCGRPTKIWSGRAAGKREGLIDVLPDRADRMSKLVRLTEAARRGCASPRGLDGSAEKILRRPPVASAPQGCALYFTPSRRPSSVLRRPAPATEPPHRVTARRIAALLTI